MITTQIYNAYAIAWNLDGNWLWVKNTNAALTITNPIWVKSDLWYNNYVLQWWASTSLTSQMFNYCWVYYWEHDWIKRNFIKRRIDVSSTTPIANPVVGHKYWLIKIYNVRALTKAEEDILYMEWLWLLWENSTIWFNNLLSWCVWILQWDWLGWLNNLVNWNKLTKVSWNSCIDIIGNNLWIKNPNFTYSISFTNSYCYKNWVFTKNDSWISTSWISWTWEYSTIYLFNRTLSTEEELSLEINSKDKYLNKYRTWDNNYYWIINSVGFDFINKNQWSITWSVSIKKYMNLDVMKFDWASYINMWDIYDIWLSNFSFGCRVKCLPTTTTKWIFNKSFSNSQKWRWWYVYTSTQLYSLLDVNTWATGSLIVQPSNITDWNWHRLVSTVNRNWFHLFYIDGRFANWVNISSYVNNVLDTTANTVIGCYPWATPTSYTNFFDWEVALPFVEYRELTAKEVMADYYSQKWNFII